MLGLVICSDSGKLSPEICLQLGLDWGRRNTTCRGSFQGPCGGPQVLNTPRRLCLGGGLRSVVPFVALISGCRSVTGANRGHPLGPDRGSVSGRTIRRPWTGWLVHPSRQISGGVSIPIGVLFQHGHCCLFLGAVLCFGCSGRDSAKINKGQ